MRLPICKRNVDIFHSYIRQSSSFDLPDQHTDAYSRTYYIDIIIEYESFNDKQKLSTESKFKSRFHLRSNLTQPRNKLGT